MLWSVLVVALGVGYLAGSLSLLSRVNQGLSDLAGTGSERAPLVVEGVVAVDSPLEQVRQLVPAGLVEQLRQVDGVAGVDRRIEEMALILDRNGKPLVPLGVTERPMAAAWPEIADLNPYSIVGTGRAPTEANEVAIDRGTARRGGLTVGDNVLIITKSGLPKQYVITAVVTLGGVDLPAGSSLALFQFDNAQTLFGRGTDLNAIAVSLRSGVSSDAVRARIKAVLPPGTEVTDRAGYEKHRLTSMAKSFSLITALLVVFAAIALAVGAFAVANSNALVFARRRQSFALLRLVGAAPRHLLRGSLIESAGIGTVAVALGIPLGLGVGKLIERALSGLGTAIPVAGPVLTPAVVGACLVVGVLVSVATSLMPAIDAARVPPIVAVTRYDDSVQRSTPWWLRLFAWMMVGVVAGLGVGWSLGLEPQFLGIAIGAGAALALLLALIPLVLTRLVSLCTRVFAGRSRALRSLVELRSRRARTRAASTTAAMLMATFVVALLATVSTSFVESVDRQVSDAVTADIVVDSGTFSRGGLNSSLVSQISGVDGVEAVSGMRIAQATIGSVTTRVSGMNGAALMQVVDLGLGTTITKLAPDEMILSRRLADLLRTGVGQRVLVSMQTSVRQLRVAGISDRMSVLLGEAVLGEDVVESSTPSSVNLVALVKSAPGRHDEVRATVERLAANFGVSSVRSPAEMISERTKILRGFQQVVLWMLVFSVGIAVIGVANTMQISVNERRREIGLIRAVGGSARQVIRLVMVEAAALSLVGVVLGLGLGVGAAWAIVHALAGLGLGVFNVPRGVIAATGGAALLLGLGGAFGPALAASRSGIMEAMAEESTRSGWLRRARRRGRGETAPPRRTMTMIPADAPVPPPPPPLVPPQPTMPRTDPLPPFGPNSAVPPPPPPAGPTGPPPLPKNGVHAQDAPRPRCFNCGEDAGTGAHCPHCGAQQIEQPVGMFSTRPEAPSEPVETAPAAPPAILLEPEPRPHRAGTGLWSTGHGQDLPPNRRDLDHHDERHHHDQVIDADPVHTAPEAPGTDHFHADVPDIVDAAVVEDDWDEHVDAADPSAASDAFSPFTAAPSAPDVDHDAQVFEVGDRPIERPNRWTAPWQSTAASQPIDQLQPPPLPPDAASGVPPAPSAAPQPHPPAAPANFGGPAGSQADLRPDTHPAPPTTALGVVASRMSTQGQRSGAVALTIVGALLRQGEIPIVAVHGWALGLSTVVVLTSERVLVVSDRELSPVVEEFALGSGLNVHGRHVDGSAAIVLVRGERMVSIDQIPDVQLAVELVTAARSRAVGSSF